MDKVFLTLLVIGEELPQGLDVLSVLGLDLLFVAGVVAADGLLGLFELRLSKFYHDLGCLNLLLNVLDHLRVHLVVVGFQLLLFDAFSAQEL